MKDCYGNIYYDCPKIIRKDYTNLMVVAKFITTNCHDTELYDKWIMENQNIIITDDKGWGLIEEIKGDRKEISRLFKQKVIEAENEQYYWDQVEAERETWFD